MNFILFSVGPNALPPGVFPVVLSYSERKGSDNNAPGSFQEKVERLKVVKKKTMGLQHPPFLRLDKG